MGFNVRTLSRPSGNIKPLRSIRMVKPMVNGTNGEIEITFTRGNKTEVFRYWLDRIESPLGDAFLVEKQGDQRKSNEKYHVLLAQDGHSCECKGFLRHDHCKHVSGLLALKAAGRI